MNLIKYLYNAYKTYRRDKAGIKTKVIAYKQYKTKLFLKSSGIESRMRTAKYYQRWLAAPDEIVTWGKVELAMFDNELEEFRKLGSDETIFPQFKQDMNVILDSQATIRGDYVLLVEEMRKNNLTKAKKQV